MATVQQLVSARWGVQLGAVAERFAEPGWSYEEPVLRSCPVCRGQLHSLRKPYESRGRQQRYVALVCPVCPGLFTLTDLGLRTYDQVKEPGRPVGATQPSRRSRPGTDAAVRPRRARATAPPPATSAPARPVQADGEVSRRRDVLRYWRSVELFAAQTLERPNPRERRYAPRPGDPLPWQEGHPLARQDVGTDLVWRHSVYGGVFSLDRVHAVTQQVLGTSPEDVDERIPRGETALFAVVVTSDGRMLLDSLVLSTAAWAAGRTTEPGPDGTGWLDGFDADEQGWTDRVRDLVAAADDDHEAAGLLEDGIAVSQPVGPRLLAQVVEMTSDWLGVTETLQPEGSRVHTERVKARREFDAQSDFLNSFFVEDLRRVADAAASGDCGPALVDYLSSDHIVGGMRRWDVRDPEQTGRLLDELAPDRVPAGRWPAKPAHSLATSQQLAINALLHRLSGNAGVFAVNGPPGTGKTTMLRDLIAALVVERARRLATLRSPAGGFTGAVLRWKTDKKQRRIQALKPELTGFEMLVASANNGALANVTREIPQAGAIDEHWAGEASYLREHAERVLGEPAWGLVAAMLGNKSNRREFLGRFWYGDPADPRKKAGDEGPGFYDWLRQAESAPASSWAQAVTAFTDALATEKRLRDARQHAHTVLRRLPQLQRAVEAAAVRHDQAAADHRRAEAGALDAAATAAAARLALEAAASRRAAHRDLKPGFWENLFTFGKAIRRWHAEDTPLYADHAEAEQHARTAADAEAVTRRAAQAAAEAVTRAAAVHARSRVERDAAAAAVAQACRDCPGAVPDEGWLADTDRRELAAPWADEEWNIARTEVFLAALNLHTAFLAGAAGIMRSNLAAAADILSGQAPGDAPAEAIRAAWQSLFMVVPVISSTFASVDRLLRPLGAEALGWLLVDEAGQAAPQQAAGAIWRSRRLVAVGDPLQLEPVITVLHTTQQALRRHHRVAETWLPGGGSVQTLTDRLTPLGTHLPDPNDPGSQVWVGAPLRVHRRCDNPMFDIVNIAVYDNLMIHGVAPRRHPLTIGGSSWTDVVSTEAEGNWIPAEGDAAARIIDYLISAGVGPDRIMMISPFRDPARRLRQRWLPIHPQMTCGTVHTAQGREADVVLFVLGGNPTRPGARAWAAGRPNLFNVAVSRARQRLYVIGNRDGWAKLPYFSTLAQELPTRRLKGPQA